MLQFFIPPLRDPDLKLPKNTGKELKTPQVPIPVSMFFRPDGYSASNGVDSVTFDLILSEDHALTSVVSSHPVQDGSVISDHITNDLRKGSLKGLVSNFSVTRGSFDAEDEITIGETTAVRNLSKNAASQAWDIFKEIWEAKQLVTIVTVLEVYEDVAITSVAASRNMDSGEAQVFDIQFQQVKRVKLKEATITATNQPKKMDNNLDRQASVKIDTGRKVGTEVSTSVVGSVP